MNDESSPSPKRRITRGLTVVALLLVVSGACYGAYRFIGSLSSGPKKQVVEVVTLRLIQPPPPPPPPPPPVQKPPEPARMLEQPKEAPDKPKAAEKAPQPLALDAKAGPGSDGFGLGGRPGGQSLIGGDGGGGSRFGLYASLLQRQIQEALQKDDKLRSSHYQVVVSLWLSPTGHTERVKLVNTTGDHELDSKIESTLVASLDVPEAPPQGMPQPVNVRIAAR